MCPKCVQRPFHIGLAAGGQTESCSKHDLTTGVHALGSAQKNVGKNISKAETGAGGKGTVVRVIIAFAKSYEFGLSTDIRSLQTAYNPVPRHSTPFGTCMHMVV